MRSIVRYLIVLAILLTNSSSTLSQGYLSKFVPLEFPANTTNFLYDGDKYTVFSINFIEGREATTIIELDINFDTIRTINYFDIFFGRFGPKKYGDKYYAYGADQTNRERHLLVIMDQNFQEIKRDSFYPEFITPQANGMTMIGDKIIGSAWDYYDCEELNECTFMNYKVITTEGDELQSFNVDEEDEPYFFSFEVDHTADGDIICGGNRYELPYAKASVYKSSQEGNILWKYDSTQRQSRGNVPVWVEELSNGNIVYTDKLDKTWDDDYIDLGYTHLPAQLVWLSVDGDSLFSYLDTLNRESRTEFSGIKRGQGDYFFAYGQYNLNHLEPMEFDAVYGFLMKIRNNGEILWRRLYKHSEDPYGSPVIRYIYEHDNGDISTLGREVNDDGFFMWMMRVNEHGCLGEDDCDDPMVLPTTEFAQSVSIPLVEVHPNPTHEKIRLLSTSDHKIMGFSLYDLNGQIIIRQNTNKIEEEIDLSNFSNGFYILQVHLEDHQNIVRKIVKN